MNILVINAGSSSLKYQLINMVTSEVLAKGLCERIGIKASQLKHSPLDKDAIIIKKDMKDHSAAINMVIEALISPEHGVIKSMGEIIAVGHRVVHGGEFFSGSVLINAEVMDAIKSCFDLAPLHNPANYIGIEACEKVMPGVPQVAVFDTAFHQTMPKSTFLYALPYEYYQKYKVRKYGFHGTSHKYVAQRAAQILGKPIEELKLITVHLGNGSSVAAVKNGKSVDTSMGFTPLAGVVMGTRCGTIDPAIVPFLMKKENLTTDEIDDIMNKKSGVLGISGVSSDFRDLEAAANEGNSRAQMALDIFIYSVKNFVASYAAQMGGADAIIFTAGIGENNGMMRGKIVEGMEFMGVKVNNDLNLSTRSVEMDVSCADATIKTLVIPTNEELMIAIETKRLVEE